MKSYQDVYDKATSFLNMVVLGYTNSLILKSPGGLSKSFLTKKVLKDNGFVEGKDYEYHSGYVTPLALYKWMYAHRDKKILVLDDVESLLENKNSCGLLKSACWSTNDTRTVEYNSTTEKLKDVPMKFPLGARIIMCINRIPREENSDMQAMLSRSICFDFKLNLLQLKEMILDVAESFANRPKARMVAEYICNRASVSAEGINLRTLIKGMQIYEYCCNENIWQPMINELIKINPEKEIVNNLLKNAFMLEVDKIKEFRKTTGRSINMWYKYKNELLLS